MMTVIKPIKISIAIRNKEKEIGELLIISWNVVILLQFLRNNHLHFQIFSSLYEIIVLTLLYS